MERVSFCCSFFLSLALSNTLSSKTTKACQTFSIVDLEPGHVYSFRIAAVNAHGASSYSTWSLPMKTEPLYEPPRAVNRVALADYSRVVVASSTSDEVNRALAEISARDKRSFVNPSEDLIFVAWECPKERGAEITGYVVEAQEQAWNEGTREAALRSEMRDRDAGGKCKKQHKGGLKRDKHGKESMQQQLLPPPKGCKHKEMYRGPETCCVLRGFRPGSRIWLRVVALSKAGNSPPSGTSSFQMRLSTTQSSELSALKEELVHEKARKKAAEQEARKRQVALKKKAPRMKKSSAAVLEESVAAKHAKKAMHADRARKKMQWWQRLLDSLERATGASSTSLVVIFSCVVVVPVLVAALVALKIWQ